MLKTCTNIRELREKLAHHYGKEPLQLTMYLPRGGSKDETANWGGLYICWTSTTAYSPQRHS